MTECQNARLQQRADQVRMFMYEVMTNVTTNPLEWWKMNGTTRYLKFVKLAVNYLGIPATSVPSERSFSKAG